MLIKIYSFTKVYTLKTVSVSDVYLLYGYSIHRVSNTIKKTDFNQSIHLTFLTILFLLFYPERTLLNLPVSCSK